MGKLTISYTVLHATEMLSAGWESCLTGRDYPPVGVGRIIPYNYLYSTFIHMLVNHFNDYTTQGFAQLRKVRSKQRIRKSAVHHAA